MTWYRIAVGIFAALLMSGCPSPQIIKRYESVSFEKKESPSADFSIFTLDVPQSSQAKTVFNLTERGQAALIGVLAKRTKKSSGLFQALAQPIARSASTPKVFDRTKIKRRIAVSIENHSPYPADRISMAKVTLNVNTSKATFISWDKFVTQYETVDLGKLTFDQKARIEANVAPSIGNIGPLSVSPSFEAGLKEERQLRQRYVSSSGRLQPGSATIIQEGVVGIDLTGSFVLDVLIDVKANPVQPEISYLSNIFKEDGTASDQEKIVVSTRREIIPSSGRQDIQMDGELKYVIRNVTSGDDTIHEGDDIVTFISPSAPPTVPGAVLIPKELLRASVWVIKDSSRNTLLHVKRPFRANREVLLFGDFQQTVALLKWLKSTSRNQISNLPLFINDAPLSSSDMPNLIVEIKKLNW